MKHDIHNRVSALETTGVSYNFSKVMNFGPQTAYNWTCIFTQPSVNSAFQFVAKLRRPISVNET